MAAPAARSLPVEAKSPPMAEEPQRVEATLPLVLDLRDPWAVDPIYRAW